MKKIKMTVLSFLALGTLSVFNANAQTALSGAASNGCGTPASDGTGSNNTAVGCGANAGSSGSYNTAVGGTSGSTVMTGTANVCVGYSVGVAITSGKNNTFVGAGSGVSNTTPSSNTYMGAGAGGLANASNNIFVGVQAGYNCAETENIAIGIQALYTQGGYVGGVSPSYNVAIGNYALFANQPTSNSNGINNAAVGDHALYSNTTGYNNNAHGYKALYANTTGSYNTATGGYALNAVSTTTANTANGYEALYVATGSDNTAVGLQAGLGVTTGSNNTFLGRGADVTGFGNGTLSNMTAIGSGALSNAANTMWLGNAALVSVNIPAGATYNGSDGRFKTNVTENVKGLAFINKLRPVTYNMNTKALDDYLINGMADSIKTMHKAGLDFAPSMAIVHSGFIAQEVEQAAQQVGFNSSIVKTPANSNDIYALNYAEIGVASVKAIQELYHIVDSLRSVKGAGNRTMQNNNQGQNETTLEIKLTLPLEISMSEARPNPNNGKAEIDYYLPPSASNAKIIFTDMLGRVINEVKLVNGYGTISVDTQDLPSGMYSYSLIIDGAAKDVKKMMKQ
ncbi:MAG TPA: tail fiber domain-containing protein [Bacteroidia bacterium]